MASTSAAPSAAASAPAFQFNFAVGAQPDADVAAVEKDMKAAKKSRK